MTKLKNCPICGDKMRFDTEPHEKWVNVTFGTHDTVIEQYYIAEHSTGHEDGLTDEQATCPYRMPLRAMPTKAMAARQWNERVDEYLHGQDS